MHSVLTRGLVSDSNHEGEATVCGAFKDGDVRRPSSKYRSLNVAEWIKGYGRDCKAVPVENDVLGFHPSNFSPGS